MSWVKSLMALVSRVMFGPQSFTDQMPMDEGEGGLRSAWRSWQEMTFDRGRAGAPPAPAVDLSDLNSRITVIFHDYFEGDELSGQAREDLERCQATLAQFVPTLSGNDRQYFAMASSIARGILEASREPTAGRMEVGR
jgi:hypothetical protein